VAGPSLFGIFQNRLISIVLFSDNMGRFWILVSGCSMFLKFNLGELLIIQDQVSSIQYRFHNAAL